MTEKALIYEFETGVCHLKGVSNTLDLLVELLSKESFQHPEQFNEGLAITFVRRFDYYWSALDLVSRDMRRQIEGLDSIVEKCYKKEYSKNGN